ncbi:MAG: quinone oxidoreductase [Proteobacteria bacterium]|nr:quinone oxidoreductase [Pseudomonadota bacterium]
MDLMIRMTGPGGADRLEAMPGTPQPPNDGEIRVRHDAIGVNFIDIYFRQGLYPLPAYPAVLGVEGAGIVEAVGSGVVDLSPGDRIAYAGAPIGAYASTRLLPQGRALRLPDGISTRLAAASMLRGLTAHMLLKHLYRVGPDTTLLVHAAAGGLGAMLVRWAKHLGATVIGTAGSEAKAAMATTHGADHVIVGRNADLEKEVRALTEGMGVDYAIDGIGGDTLQRTFGCVRPFGLVASVGQAAGFIPPLSVEALGPRRSISLARPSVMAYSANPILYKTAAADLFAAMARGIVPEIGAEYRLSQAAQAHSDLEAGRTTGSLLLIPD